MYKILILMLHNIDFDILNIDFDIHYIDFKVDYLYNSSICCL